MHWKGLRLTATDGSNNGSKRYSAIFPSSAFRHSEHGPRPSTPSATQLARRQSDSGPCSRIDEAESDAVQPTTAERPDEPTENANATPPETPTERRQSLRRSRFNMLRFRHASDPQLSSSYAQADPDAPPVPPLPPRKFYPTSCLSGVSTPLLGVTPLLTVLFQPQPSSPPHRQILI